MAKKKRLFLCASTILILLALCSCESSAPDKESTSDTVQTESIEQNEVSYYDIWIASESATPARDMYENVIHGFRVAEDEISRRWLDESTKNFIRLIKGTSVLDNATSTDMITTYRSFDDKIAGTSYSIVDFFTADEYGDSTNTGVYNFLEAVDQLESTSFGGKDVVTTGENNYAIAFDFDSVGGDGVVAEALGISEDLVIILLHAAQDAGFEITFT